MNVSMDDIRKAKEKLGDQTADLIKDILQLERFDPIRKSACCPIPSHKDDTPSFIYNPKNLTYHCFGCGATIDIIDAYMMTGETFLGACEKLFDHAGMTISFAERGAKSSRHYRYPEPQYSSDKGQVYAYWRLRKISHATVDYLDMQQDKHGNTLFQFRDANDVLVGVKVRPSRPVKKGEAKCWWLKDPNGNPYDTPNVLFNQNRINPAQPLIITSGEGDCAACIESGLYNAVSICGGDNNLQWIAEQWDFLNGFDSIILVHDNDESGEKFAKEVTTRLGEWRVKLAEVPRVVETNGEKHAVKDLNDLLFFTDTAEVREVINNAREADIPSIVDYTEVAKFDHTQLDGFTSGFAKLDSALGKFYATTTTIITGIASSGKSSFLSSLICQSIEQDMPVMVYSGELSNESLKQWVDMCFAGQRGIAQYKNADGSPYYRLTNETYRKINSTYKGKCFFYKDSFSHKTEDLLKAAENAVRIKGVKTVIFDNMSSVSLGGSDDSKWTRQEEFVKQIVDFGKRWNVCCIVVVHPKKMEAVRRMSIMDVGGVSAIFNLAHRVLSLYRVQESDRDGKRNKDGGWKVRPLTCSVVLDVLKDRLGSANGCHVELYYDKPSRRFYDTRANLDRRYSWSNGIDYGDSDLPYGCEMLDLEREVFG